MHLKHTVPVGITGMAKLMNMHEAEVREWPYVEDMRAVFKDYNLGVLDKRELVARLNDISVKCAEAQIYHYSTGIDNAIKSINLSY